MKWTKYPRPGGFVHLFGYAGTGMNVLLGKVVGEGSERRLEGITNKFPGAGYTAFNIPLMDGRDWSFDFKPYLKQTDVLIWTAKVKS